MSWTAPRTWVAGENNNASTMNTHIRDNLNALIWDEDAVATSETRANTAFGDLATVGPAVTLTCVSRAFVWVGCQMSNNTLGDGVRMSYAISGATTTAAGDDWSVSYISPAAGDIAQIGRFSRIAVTAGSNTFTAKYATITAGTGTFLRRKLLALAVG